MKKSIVLLGLMSLFMLTTAMQCDEDDSPVNCGQTVQVLAEYKASIQSLAAESVCNDDFECRFIAFGSKPCGGPWEFLIYSTSIDTFQLMTFVADYNQLEANYNLLCNAVSDCSTPQPPTGFGCENNLCIPTF